MTAAMQEINTKFDTLLEHLVNINPTMHFKELTIIKLRYDELSEFRSSSGDGVFTTFKTGERELHLYVRESVINEEEGYAVGTLTTYSPVRDSFVVRFPTVALDPFQSSFSREELDHLAIPFKNGQLTYNLSANSIDVRDL